MASHTLIDTQIAALARQLPGPVVDELADGLTETYQHHLARGRAPADAAEAAIDEFGRPEEIIAAFTRQAPGRRTALALLATGPVLATGWGLSLILGHAWSWPVPAVVPVALGLVLLGVVATLLTAALSRRYHRTRLAGAGATGLIVLDVSMLAVVLLGAPALVWPMALAIPASLARIGLTARALPRTVA